MADRSRPPRSARAGAALRRVQRVAAAPPGSLPAEELRHALTTITTCERFWRHALQHQANSCAEARAGVQAGRLSQRQWETRVARRLRHQRRLEELATLRDRLHLLLGQVPR